MGVTYGAYGTITGGGGGSATQITVNSTLVVGGVPRSILYVNNDGTVGSSANFLYVDGGDAFAVTMYSESNTADHASAYTIAKSRVGTTALQNGDTVGTMGTIGYDGATYQACGSIKYVVSGVVAANQVPMSIEFWTSATNAAAATCKMFVNHAGLVGIGYGASSNTILAQMDIKASGNTSGDEVVRYRHTNGLQDLFIYRGDASFVYYTEAGSIIFQHNGAAVWGLGINADITNADLSDVIIGNSANVTAAGANQRIAIGNGSSAQGYYAVAIGALSTTVTADGGIRVGFGGLVNAQGGVGIGPLMGASASGAVMVGSNYNYAQQNNIAHSFMVNLDNATGTGSFQDFFISQKTNVVLRNNTELTAGTHYKTAATNVITIHNGTDVPDAAIANAIQVHAKDTTEGTPLSTLALYTETVPDATIPIPDSRGRIWWNGVEYYVALEAI